MKHLPLTYFTLFTGLTSLFTCGGLDDSHYLTEAEVIDLPSLEGAPLPQTCNQADDIPSSKSGHFAIWDSSDNSVLCCGGYSDGSKDNRCFKYTGDKWIDLGEILRRDREYSSAAQLSDGSYWIAGGYRYKPSD